MAAAAPPKITPWEPDLVKESNTSFATGRRRDGRLDIASNNNFKFALVLKSLVKSCFLAVPDFN